MGDPDRDAILKRRQRFIALALSGLTAGAMGCAQTCLKYAPQPKQGEKTEDGQKTEEGEEKTAEKTNDEKTGEGKTEKTAPQVCLRKAH